MKIEGPKKPKNSQPAQAPAVGKGSSRPAGEAESPISFRHLLLLLGAGILILAAISLALESYWKGRQPMVQDTRKLVLALQAFSRDQFIHGKQMPSNISLKDLVTAGYLSAEDVQAFDGIEVTFSNAETNGGPQHVMIHARLPDGTVLALLEDGSVQQIKK